MRAGQSQSPDCGPEGDGGAGLRPEGDAGDQVTALFRHEVLAVVFQVRTPPARSAQGASAQGARSAQGASAQGASARGDSARGDSARGDSAEGHGHRLEVLLWRRARQPFDGCWSLPGGPLGGGERLGTSLGRHLAAKVALTDIAHLEQLETRSDPERDPRGRVLATAYLALVATDVHPGVPADTAWHPVGSLPPTAFDHESIIGSARDRLRAKLSYTNLGFALAPATFTITELRGIYAATLGHPVAATNLQRILVRRNVIEATHATVPPTAAGGRPATLYRFAARTLLVTNPFAAFRPPVTGTGAADPQPGAAAARLGPTAGPDGPTAGQVGPTAGQVGPTAGPDGPPGMQVGPAAGQVGPTATRGEPGH